MNLDSEYQKYERHHTLNQRFKGYQKSNQLWHSKDLEGLIQFPVDLTTDALFLSNSQTKRLPLGKWAEKFVEFQVVQHPRLTYLDSNLQIKRKGITIGELDLLILEGNDPVHLEIVYKFYLFDPKLAEKNTLDGWIGPNRKDTLRYKLDKLNSKQLPLMHQPESLKVLHTLGIDYKNIKQQVIFKAQTFLPVGVEQADYFGLNPKTYSGRYFQFEEFRKLKSCQFYIPSKLDWMVQPHHGVNWIEFKEADTIIVNTLNASLSPMIWIKAENSTLSSAFITWW